MTMSYCRELASVITWSGIQLIISIYWIEKNFIYSTCTINFVELKTIKTKQVRRSRICLWHRVLVYLLWTSKFIYYNMYYHTLSEANTKVKRIKQNVIHTTYIYVCRDVFNYKQIQNLQVSYFWKQNNWVYHQTVNKSYHIYLNLRLVSIWLFLTDVRHRNVNQ